MNIYPHIPYTYLIGWSQYNKWYYGVKFGENTNPRNFWKTYFTSSRKVKAFRDQYGEPDIIQVRQCFLDKSKAVEWESKVLRRISNKAVFLNQTFGSVKGLIFTDEMLQKISEKGKGRVRSEYHKQRMLEGLRSEETQQKLKEARKSYVVSEETKAKISKSLAGRKKEPVSEEIRKRMSEARKEWHKKNKISMGGP